MDLEGREKKVGLGLEWKRDERRQDSAMVRDLKRGVVEVIDMVVVVVVVVVIERRKVEKEKNEDKGLYTTHFD